MTTRQPIWIMMTIALLTSCAAAPRADVPATPLCAATSFPTNESVGGWSVDKFAGLYTHGADRLMVRRDEHRLLVQGWMLGTRELTSESVQSWSWHDGCGVRYDFVLPPDGPGAWLKITMPAGAVTEWHR